MDDHLQESKSVNIVKIIAKIVPLVLVFFLITIVFLYIGEDMLFTLGNIGEITCYVLISLIVILSIAEIFLFVFLYKKGLRNRQNID